MEKVKYHISKITILLKIKFAYGRRSLDPNHICLFNTELLFINNHD